MNIIISRKPSLIFKVVLLLVLTLHASRFTLHALPSFDIIWGNQNKETIALLRMVGIVQKEDLSRLNTESQKILLLAFDKNGELTPFGRRLLEELVSAKLDLPNKAQGKKSRAFEDLKVKARLAKIELFKAGQFYEKVHYSAAKPFLGNRPNYPVVYSGMHSWKDEDIGEGCFVVSPPSGRQAKTESIRILVTPKHPVVKSRYNVYQKANYKDLAREALTEVQIDPQILEKYKAKLISTLSLFNIVSIEVPKKHAKELALALESQGNAAAPSKFKILLGVPLGRVPAEHPFSAGLFLGARKAREVLSRAGAPLIGPMLDSSVAMLKPTKFYQAGIRGEQAAALIVDSGLDKNHPDFAGRRIVQQDFTDDKDNRDYVGHGSHVASIALGSGIASAGKYQGVAPQTGTVFVAKVFGKNPTTSEDTILAGLDWGASRAQGKKLVINLSLGGPGDANDALSRGVNLLVHQGHTVNVAAGNSGPRENTVSSPGVARDAITLAATDKNGRVTQYSSRGNPKGYETPAREKAVYSKPDLALPGGDVQMNWKDRFRRLIGLKPRDTKFEIQALGECRYGPGITAAKSADMAPSPCDIVIDGKPFYTKMAGTSMATPHGEGIGLLVNDLLERKGATKETSSLESKAAQIESAVVLKNAEGKPYAEIEQGRGMPDLDRLYDLVTSRLEAGLPIGNISAVLAFSASSDQRISRDMRRYSSYRVTPFGIVSVKTANVINSDQELDKLAAEIEKNKKGEWFWTRWWKRFFGKDSQADILEK